MRTPSKHLDAARVRSGTTLFAAHAWSPRRHLGIDGAPRLADESAPKSVVSVTGAVNAEKSALLDDLRNRTWQSGRSLRPPCQIAGALLPARRPHSRVPSHASRRVHLLGVVGGTRTTPRSAVLAISRDSTPAESFPRCATTAVIYARPLRAGRTGRYGYGGNVGSRCGCAEWKCDRDTARSLDAEASDTRWASAYPTTPAGGRSL